MKLYNQVQYNSDLHAVAESLVCKKNLQNKSVLITGATGMICSAIVDLLCCLNDFENTNIKIYAACRSKDKFCERFDDNERLEYVEYDATKAFHADFAVDYIIHGASNASPELYVSKPVDTMMSNIFGIHQLLEYVRHSNSASGSSTRVLYISSSEVYGQKSTSAPFSENDYGFVDVLNVRSSYPIGKRASETLCKAYTEQYGIACVIARPGHIYGPSASAADLKVSSLFAFQASRGEDLIMKSAGQQVRSYCYSLDCASAILTVLCLGVAGEAYNISNKNSVISVREMAEFLAEGAGVNLRYELPTGTEVSQFNPMNHSSLDSEKLEALGWTGVFDAKTGLNHTVQILKACAEQPSSV